MEKYRTPMEGRVRMMPVFHVMTDSTLMAMQKSLALMEFGHIPRRFAKVKRHIVIALLNTAKILHYTRIVSPCPDPEFLCYP